jgi:hypothetical protein
LLGRVIGQTSGRFAIATFTITVAHGIHPRGVNW